MHQRQHEPIYANCPDTRIPLRSQEWVKSFETAACANEPTQVQEAHSLKAKGSTNGIILNSWSSSDLIIRLTDTYTTDELVRMSIWTLRAFGPARSHTHTGLRDRAMLLLSTTIAFRGNSSRLVLLSDLFFREIPMGTIGEGVKLQVGALSMMMTTSTVLILVYDINRHWESWPISRKQMLLAVSTSMAYFATVFLNSARLGALDFISLAISTSLESACHLLLISMIPSTPNMAGATGTNFSCSLEKEINLKE